jgi:hypothetical protein
MDDGLLAPSISVSNVSLTHCSMPSNSSQSKLLALNAGLIAPYAHPRSGKILCTTPDSGPR